MRKEHHKYRGNADNVPTLYQSAEHGKRYPHVQKPKGARCRWIDGIFCLNRSSDARQRTELALQQLGSDFSAQSPRLHFWVTDMTQPEFGLTSIQAGILAFQVNELVFNAWDPHWNKKLAYFDPFLGGICNAM
jgi:hypothetical protein